VVLSGAADLEGATPMLGRGSIVPGPDTSLLQTTHRTRCVLEEPASVTSVGCGQRLDELWEVPVGQSGGSSGWMHS
jgi:hypothetical protein